MQSIGGFLHRLTTAKYVVKIRSNRQQAECGEHCCSICGADARRPELQCLTFKPVSELQGDEGGCTSPKTVACHHQSIALCSTCQHQANHSKASFWNELAISKAITYAFITQAISMATD